MKNIFSLLSILLLGYNTIFAQSNGDGSFALKEENGHYYFETQINDKVPAKNDVGIRNFRNGDGFHLCV